MIRPTCPKCGGRGRLVAAVADAEAPVDVWECRECGHHYGEDDARPHSEPLPPADERNAP